LEAVAKFGAPTATILLPWVLLVIGRKDFGCEQEEGRKSIHGDGVDRDTEFTTIF